MKRILLALLLIPSLAFAGPEVTENDLITDPKVGTYILGRMNEDASVITATEGDAIAPSLNSRGQFMFSLQAGAASASNPIMIEDSAFPDLQALMAVGIKLQSAITADAAANDAGSLKGDTGGRLVATMAPAGETGTACSSEVTNTTASAILGAVASNRWYVTTITCSNNSAVASRISFLDGAGVKAIGGVGTLAATGGGLVMTFNPPIRGSVNTAFNMQMTTTSTATTCCATGYYSTI